MEVPTRMNERAGERNLCPPALEILSAKDDVSLLPVCSIASAARVLLETLLRVFAPAEARFPRTLRSPLLSLSLVVVVETSNLNESDSMNVQISTTCHMYMYMYMYMYRRVRQHAHPMRARALTALGHAVRPQPALQAHCGLVGDFIGAQLHRARGAHKADGDRGRTGRSDQRQQCHHKHGRARR